MHTDMKLWNDVRHAILIDGMSLTEAREKFGIHDTTIQKMLAHSEPPGYTMSQPRAKPKLEEHRAPLKIRRIPQKGDMAPLDRA